LGIREWLGSYRYESADDTDLTEFLIPLRDELVAGNTLLIKGSRGSAMDRVVDALLAGPAENGGRHAA